MNEIKKCRCEQDPEVVNNSRRNVVIGSLAIAVSGITEATAGRSKRPEPGDNLVYMLGDKKDQPIKASEVEIGNEPILAYPKDPSSGKVLVSKANLLTIIRVKPADMKESSRPNAADGVVAFSAVCTHYGCPITKLHPSQSQVVCNCHGSVFDAANRGEVTSGPATRRLAMLPLKVVDGNLIVAAKLDGPIGPPT